MALEPWHMGLELRTGHTGGSDPHSVVVADVHRADSLVVEDILGFVVRRSHYDMEAVGVDIAVEAAVVAYMVGSQAVRHASVDGHVHLLELED